MTKRTCSKTVTFKRPFVLAGFSEVLPAGSYYVETDEELIEGISFLAYRRILTLLHLPAKSGNSGLTRTLTIDPNELEEALKRDQVLLELPVGRDVSPTTLNQTTRMRQGETDSQAIERGENEGMIAHLPWPLRLNV
jgi:hypothetical protein